MTLATRRPVSHRAHMGTVKIPFVTFRPSDGLPGFYPSPAQRRMGYGFKWLAHADGRPFTLDECAAWSRAFARELVEKRAQQGRRAPRARPQGLRLTLGHMLEQFREQAPRMQGGTVEGRKRVTGLSPATVQFYVSAINAVRTLGADAAALKGRMSQAARAALEEQAHFIWWSKPLEAFGTAEAEALVDEVWRERGLHQARAVRAMLSVAFAWAARTGVIAVNVMANATIRLEMPQGRIRAATVAEVLAYIAAAEAEGRPELADMKLFSVLTGQRQTDRLAAHRRDCRDEAGKPSMAVWLNPQSKKHGQPLAIALAPLLQQRFEAAFARRKGWPVQHGELVADEKKRGPWSPDHFRHEDARIRAIAARAVPSIATLTDQDGRDTFAQWAQKAGADDLEIINVLGHSIKKLSTLKRHYAANNPALAATTLAKVAAWFETEAGKADAVIAKGAEA
jgi:hypothetical protein